MYIHRGESHTPETKPLTMPAPYLFYPYPAYAGTADPDAGILLHEYHPYGKKEIRR